MFYSFLACLVFYAFFYISQYFFRYRFPFFLYAAFCMHFAVFLYHWFEMNINQRRRNNFNIVLFKDFLFFRKFQRLFFATMHIISGMYRVVRLIADTIFINGCLCTGAQEKLIFNVWVLSMYEVQDKSASTFKRR